MKNVRLNMEVPSSSGQAAASGGFVRVGIVAVIGFAVGIAWPRAMGLQLGPAPIPSLAGSNQEPESAELLKVAGTAAPTAAASASAAPSAAPSGPVAVTIAKGVVLSCKNSDGETLKGRECGGAPKGLDAFVAPHLTKLGQCPAAGGAQGKLSAVVTFDFRGNRLTTEVGKSSTVTATEPLGKCLKEAFTGVELPTVNHEHSRYAMAFSLQFDGPAKGVPSAAPSAEAPEEAPTPDAPSASASATAAPAPAGGSLEIEWDTARVRNSPRTGEIIARWNKGTKVTVLSQQGGWYKVKRDGSSEEGWVYKSALGK